ERRPRLLPHRRERLPVRQRSTTATTTPAGTRGPSRRGGAAAVGGQPSGAAPFGESWSRELLDQRGQVLVASTYLPVTQSLLPDRQLGVMAPPSVLQASPPPIDSL